MMTCGIVWIIPLLPLEMVTPVACHVVGTEVQGKAFNGEDVSGNGSGITR